LLVFTTRTLSLTFAPPYLRVWGLIASDYLVPTFGAHRGPSLKTTLAMSPRRTSQRFHQDEGLPQASDQNQISFHQPPTQVLPTIAEAAEHPTFDILEIQLQQANMSNTTAGSSQNDGGTSSTQTNGGDSHQSPPRAPSPV
jgi:hypothetical protein